MKQLFLFWSILLCAFASGQSTGVPEVKSSSVDSFYFHYNILDSISKKNGGYDRSILCVSAVKYLEKLTGLKAHPDGSYIGWKHFSSADLVAWKNWQKRYYPEIEYTPKF